MDKRGLCLEGRDVKSENATFNVELTQVLRNGRFLIPSNFDDRERRDQLANRKLISVHHSMRSMETLNYMINLTENEPSIAVYRYPGFNDQDMFIIVTTKGMTYLEGSCIGFED